MGEEIVGALNIDVKEVFVSSMLMDVFNRRYSMIDVEVFRFLFIVQAHLDSMGGSLVI